MVRTTLIEACFIDCLVYCALNYSEPSETLYTGGFRYIWRLLRVRLTQN
ncbi:hypothetical protein HDF14_003346 [Edaphobacter lichenicola]|jgi:hypothetical protein|uniref:Uncharacterized protein n=1 Tax=Tunturiibacter gelidiferens TaxID=3069689 RepID=A0A9X0U4S4_9BACT|nr:hypothetical protein [Edaphobacter lichenicola]